MRLVRNWNVIVEKFKAKLKNWKATILSFDKRLTLVNSVLNSLPLYYFWLFWAPKRIILFFIVLKEEFFREGDQ